MTHQLDIYIVHSPRHQGVQAHATLVSDSHRNLYFVNSANVLACLGSGSRAASPSSSPILALYSGPMIHD